MMDILDSSSEYRSANVASAPSLDASSDSDSEILALAMVYWLCSSSMSLANFLF